MPRVDFSRTAMIRSLWCAVIVLAIVGVAAAAGRAFFIADLVTRAEPVRLQMMNALGRDDPRAWERPAEARRFDSPYAAHPVLTLMHVIPGAIFLVLAPLQFVPRIRNRHLALHRWSGRFLIVTAFVGTATALYFGIVMPFGGLGEAAAIALFAGVFLTALTRAFVAIRRGDVTEHREWMIRAFAIAISISTIRVVGVVLEIILTPLGFPVKDGFVLALWIGWLLTWGVAEVWIRYTRPSRVAPSWVF